MFNNGTQYYSYQNYLHDNNLLSLYVFPSFKMVVTLEYVNLHHINAINCEPAGILSMWLCSLQRYIQKEEPAIYVLYCLIKNNLKITKVTLFLFDVIALEIKLNM